LFTYKCDNAYAPEQEGSIIYNDTTLGIDWQIPENNVILSEKDRTGSSFKEYRENPCF
jgi:dTDP-4-dehydrorhamnose 3,5-epimerase